MNDLYDMNERINGNNTLILSRDPILAMNGFL